LRDKAKQLGTRWKTKTYKPKRLVYNGWQKHYPQQKPSKLNDDDDDDELTSDQ
jgi:type 1 glutamine amidotransferase